MQDNPTAMPEGIGLDDITHAYIGGILTNKPLHQPAFQCLSLVNGKWMRISYTITHEWLDQLPPEVMAILPTAGKEH
jgi:hypothetical protein